MPWKADTEAYLCFYSSCPTLVFYGLEKVFYAIILKGSLHTTIFWKYTELLNILKLKINILKNIFKIKNEKHF